VGIFRIDRPMKGSISLFIDASDQVPLILPKMQEKELLMLR